MARERCLAHVNKGATTLIAEDNFFSGAFFGNDLAPQFEYAA